MSVRLACLLSAALLGSALATPALAHGAGAKHASHKSSLVWRGDVASANSVVEAMAHAWEKAGHGHISLQPFNTASGLDALAAGTANLAGAARGSDGSAMNQRLTFTPVAWSAVVLMTNASNHVPDLSLKEVHDIYYGKIHNWSEVGGRNRPIDVYAVATPGDGVEYSLRELLFGRGNQPVAAPRLYVNTGKLAEGVALNPDGFGAGTLATVRDNKKLRAIPINGKAPTPANIADGSYPLYIPMYIVTNPNGAKADEAAKFVEFVRSEAGKKVLRNKGVLPYDDGKALIAKNEERRAAILAAVGARRHRTVAAPGATYASRSAIAPTSADTLAARRALETRQDTARQEAALKSMQSATTYTVGKGDTLSRIASKFSVRTSDLKLWNHLANDQIKPGQVLRVSAD